MRVRIQTCLFSVIAVKSRSVSGVPVEGNQPTSRHHAERPNYWLAVLFLSTYIQ